MIVPQCILRFSTFPALAAHGNSLRGFFSRIAPENILLHHHLESDKCLYIYPRIQYKTISGEGFVVGLSEGTETVSLLGDNLNEIEINGKVFKVTQKIITTEEVEFGCNDAFHDYHFMKPWLALNEKNYRSFFRHAKSDQSQILEKILIGNILSLAKSIGYVVENELKISEPDFRLTEAYLKGMKMVGIMGSFRMNFLIPDFWGIGKSVSRGYGTVSSRR